jgi:hypothetical protein
VYKLIMAVLLVEARKTGKLGVGGDWIRRGLLD